MKIHRNSLAKPLLILSFLILLPTTVSFSKENNDRIVTVKEYIGIIHQFEHVLNKDRPTLEDYEYLWPCCECLDNENATEENYCMQILKVGADSKQCVDFMNNWQKDKKKSVSLYLLDIKNILTDRSNQKIEFFIESGIKACSSPDDMATIKVIAKIGDNKYKDMNVDIPCNFRDIQKEYKFNSIFINGKNLSDYPIIFTEPIK